uniref:Photolyase/cryptochrome alpha/beta domain-containing protein n=1 Tax=Aplanochytrium stocchinoi TaxID=215587 RepID=A0A7S3PN84_9STRA
MVYTPETVTVFPLINSKDPYCLRCCPVYIKKRMFAYSMPRPQARCFGRQIVYWIQLGCCNRVEDNFGLQHALSVSLTLRMPLLCLVFLPQELEDLVNQGRQAQSISNLMYLPLLKCLRVRLSQLNIPTLGFYIDQRDYPSLLAQLVRKHHIHMVFTNEGYSQNKQIKAIGRAITCPLFALDSDYILPPRYIDVNLAATDHITKIKSCINENNLNLQTLSASKIEADPSIQKSLFLCNLQQKVIYINPIISSRWKKVEWALLNNWSTSSYNKDFLTDRNFLAEEHCCGLIDKFKTHLQETTEISTEFLSGDILFAKVLSHIRAGTLSASRLALEAQSWGSGRDAVIEYLCQRERRVFVAFRKLIDAIQRNETKNPNLKHVSREQNLEKRQQKETQESGSPRNNISQHNNAANFFCSEVASSMPCPDWSVFLPEHAIVELTKNDTESNRPLVHLPGDIENGETSDVFFNSLQCCLSSTGFLPMIALSYWFQRIVVFSSNSSQGIFLAVTLIQEYVPGSSHSSVDIVYEIIQEALGHFDDTENHPILGRIKLITLKETREKMKLENEENFSKFLIENSPA